MPAGSAVPSRQLSEVEVERLSTWPPEVAHSDLVAHFTCGVEDLRWVRFHRGAANRLGLAVQLCALASQNLGALRIAGGLRFRLARWTR